MNSGVPEGLAVPSPLVTSVVLPLRDTYIKANDINKSKPTNRTSFLRENQSGHHNIELKKMKTYNLTT